MDNFGSAKLAYLLFWYARLVIIQFRGELRRRFFEYLRTRPFLLNLCVQLVDVICHRQQQDFCVNLLLTSKQKLAEAVVLLYDTESALRLD